MQKVTPFLMFNGDLEVAVAFYRSVFPDLKVESLQPDVAAFELGGQRLLAYNGGEYFKFNEAASLFVSCEDQAEVDRYWNALLAGGGQESRCGWLRDRFGLSWQIIPKALTECMSGADAEGRVRTREAMMKMGKIEVEAIEKAYTGR